MDEKKQRIEGEEATIMAMAMAMAMVMAMAGHKRKKSSSNTVLQSNQINQSVNESERESMIE